VTFGEVFLPKIDGVGSYWWSDRQLEVTTQLGPLRIASAERSVAQAEASLRVEDDLYHHDKSAAATVLDSELKLVESRVDAAHARYGTLAAVAALKTATAGGPP